jgi:predicted metal-binding membrane protein
MVLMLNRVQKIILISIVLTSAVSWFLLSRQSDADNNNVMMRAMMLYDPISISLFTASWTVGMAAMMFPAITPMVLLYNRLIGGGDNATQRQEQTDETLMVEEKQKYNNKNSLSLKLTLFVTCYLALWALTGIALLLGWSIPMNSLLVVNGKQQLVDIIFGVVLILSGLYQFSPLKTKCLGYCESPMSFFMRRWRNGVSGALKMGTYHGLYCLGCCWPYFLLMVALGWMNLLWMGLFAGIIFAEKIWSRGRGGLWVVRIAGIGFVVIGLLTIFGLITLQSTVVNTGSGNSGSIMFSGSGAHNNQGNMDSMRMGINHNPIGVETQAVDICINAKFYFLI